MNKSNEDRVISHLCDYIDSLRGAITSSPLLLKCDNPTDIVPVKDEFMQENGIRSPHPTIKLGSFLQNKTAKDNSLHIHLVDNALNELEHCKTVCVSIGKDPHWLEFENPKKCKKEIRECAMCHGRKTIDFDGPCPRCDGEGVM